MSEHDTAHDGIEPGERDASVVFENGGCLIYDRQNYKAWIQAEGERSVMDVRR